MKFFVATLVCGLLAAQQPARPPQTQPSTAPSEAPGTTFRTNVQNVQAVVTVFGQDGGYVSNIRPEQFHLFDNDQEQNINVDISYTPISLAILIQANAHVQGMLPQINRIGSLIGPQVIGDAGRAAVIAYDAHIRVLQDFTPDSTKVAAAIKSIHPGSESNRMIDAVMDGTRLLASQPPERRRIMLLIGETRDLGSEGKAREALIGLQTANIVFYPVDMSRFMSTLTAPVAAPRPDTMPPAMHPMPSFVPATPGNVEQTYQVGERGEFIPLMLEIYRDVKGIFIDNPVEVFTKGTGGTEFGFHSQRTLENALTEIGEQLHAEYTISYAPNNRDYLGYHPIRVEVQGHPEVKRIVTRPGYWVGTNK
ncbi:MAG TPA: VWA domain-containing protein [Bryobacteraceae bacterium]|nr:VWA domain-containing protein [Bryobacteraceae bacterium]